MTIVVCKNRTWSWNFSHKPARDNDAARAIALYEFIRVAGLEQDLSFYKTKLDSLARVIYARY